MATASKKLDPEIGEQETGFTEDNEETKFIQEEAQNSNGDVNVEDRIEKAEVDDFYGLSREELEKYATDPTWVRARKILLAIFIVCWALMLIAAIIIVVLTPKCPFNPDLAWYQSDVMYTVDPAKFADSDSDGRGDIVGIEDHMDHFQDLNVKTLRLSANFVNPAILSQPEPSFGSLEAFKNMTTAFKKEGMRIVLELDLTAVKSGNDSFDPSTGDDLVRSWADAGVEGFIMTLPAGSSEDQYAEFIKRWQEILDSKEYNEKDDRDRVVIGASREGSSNDTDVLMLPEITQCAETYMKDQLDKRSFGNCIRDHVKGLAKYNPPTGAPWVVPQLSDAHVAVKLTLPGTPCVVYGDEINMNPLQRTEIIWTRTSSSVQAQKSDTFSGTSTYELFRTLAHVRQEEPSLQWGNITVLDFADGVIAYVREAEGYPPVVVAVNPTTEGLAGSLLASEDSEYAQGEVRAVSNMEVEVLDTVMVDDVYLPPDSAIVMRLSIPPELEV